jgi:membrane-bound lytic murein transglycosylase B
LGTLKERVKITDNMHKKALKNSSSVFSTALMTAFLLLLPFASAISADSHQENWRFDSLANRLIEDGFKPEVIKKLYQNPKALFETRGVSLYFIHSEAKLDYDQFSNNWSIKQAKKYLKKHHNSLETIEKSFGVDKHVITAIILVETGLGNTLGTRSIFNTLSSLASLKDLQVRNDFWKNFKNKEEITKKQFEQRAARKSGWAYRELKAFLTYTSRENFDPLALKGSYAGALGIAQFMPTTAIAYARDGNQDGRIDLYNHADAMASIASFLKRFGWKPGIQTDKAKKVIYRYNHSDYYVEAIIKIRNILKG